jgi:hypothetical protein
MLHSLLVGMAEHDDRVGRHCERSEAIQATRKNWIASSQVLLAKTPRHNSAISRRGSPELSMIFRPSKNRGRRESRVCRAHPQPRARNEKAHEHSHHRFAGLTPVTGLVCHRRLADTSAKLDTSVGVSGPHDFAVRKPRSRRKRRPRPSHPAPNVRDDRETPLLRVRDNEGR